MNTALVWSNILAYSLQIGLLVAVAAFLPALMRMRAAGARLLYWQLLLAACLLLPWLRPWHREVIAANVSVTTVVTSMAAAPAPARFHVSPGNLLLYLLAAGVVARLAWLSVGLWQLRSYRRRAVPLENEGVRAEVLLSAEISSPVTFGWRRPVILLPERFPQLGDAMQQAILCHENLHVERHDWLFTVAEELVRAILWFHPAIWWLLGEIQLAREQAVDCQVVKITQSRDPYVDALLEMAGARPELDLAPAPLFLRKRHLKQRVMEIVREATMSRTRWISALAASVMFLAAATWLVTGAFPLAGAPQLVSDAPGVTVDLGGARLIHRSGVEYPVAAIAKGVQGTVVAQVKLDANGVVTDASILSGPDELRKAVLQSVLNWHFYKDADGAMRQVSVTFELPKEGTMPSTGVTGGVAAGVSGGVGTGTGDAVGGGASSYGRYGNIVADQFTVDNSDLYTSSTSVLKSIAVSGISDSAKADLLARLPVHEGDTLLAKISDVMYQVGEAVAKFDPHLHVGINIHNGIAMMRISPDEPTSSGNGETPKRVDVGSNVQALRLISKVDPVYPPLAKQAKIQGTVELSAVIGKDGRVQDLRVIRGHPLLVQAALDAVKNWVYQPTLVNGEPVEVKTSIQINFALASSENIETANRLEVSGNAQAAKLITQVAPEYPAAAKQAGIQGTVVLEAIVGKDGTVQDIKALSGPPLLAQAALDAVKNWVYQPTLLNGEPVEVKTTIQVNFTLQ
ncbi:MAG: M56 family metallopeptidase [Bryobacteraceae bacterium]